MGVRLLGDTTVAPAHEVVVRRWRKSRNGDLDRSEIRSSQGADPEKRTLLIESSHPFDECLERFNKTRPMTRHRIAETFDSERSARVSIGRALQKVDVGETLANERLDRPSHMMFTLDSGEILITRQIPRGWTFAKLAEQLALIDRRNVLRNEATRTESSGGFPFLPVGTGCALLLHMGYKSPMSNATPNPERVKDKKTDPEGPVVS